MLKLRISWIWEMLAELHVFLVLLKKMDTGYRIDLPLELIEQVSNDDQMQVIISAPGFTGGTMTFHGASDLERAPVLNLNYGERKNQMEFLRLTMVRNYQSTLFQLRVH